MEDKINKSWEKRSQNYGKQPAGVLPKFLPPILSSYLHQWMLEIIESVIDRKKTVRVLDLGCGYGRLSQSLLQEFPNLKVNGIDVSRTYVKLYNQELLPRGKAIVGSITNLPFPKNYFDTVFIVTTLMYLPQKSDQIKAVKELFRVLKSDGNFVFIERNLIGHSIITLGGIIKLIRGKSNKEIDSVSFTSREINALINQAGYKVDKMSAIPVWTLMLPLLLLASKISYKITGLLLELVSLLDNKCRLPAAVSLYLSYTGKKEK